MIAKTTDVLSDGDKLTFSAGTVEVNQTTGEVVVKTKNIGGALVIGGAVAAPVIDNEGMFKVTVVEVVTIKETIIPTFVTL